MSEIDASLPVVEELIGLYNPPPPPPCKWGCGDWMKAATTDGGFKCRVCGAWQFLALWNGKWVDEEEIPALRMKAMTEGPGTPLARISALGDEVLARGLLRSEYSSYPPEVALLEAFDSFRAALREIASADLKRCSAGWLHKIALEALQSHERYLGPSQGTEASETP